MELKGQTVSKLRQSMENGKETVFMGDPSFLQTHRAGDSEDRYGGCPGYWWESSWAQRQSGIEIVQDRGVPRYRQVRNCSVIEAMWVLFFCFVGIWSLAVLCVWCLGGDREIDPDISISESFSSEQLGESTPCVRGEP